MCPAASGISCSVGWSSCTEDWQCSGGKKCCADACNHAQCQQPCPKLDCPLAPAVLGGGCVVVQPRPDASGCVTQCPSVECTRDCNSSVPCGDGSGCFESRRCGLLSTGWGCGVQRGDFKCHPLCVTDADCPMSVPQCNEVVLWSQDAAVRRRMCFKCPVAVCPVADVGPGCQVTAAFGYNGCRQCDHVVCDNRRACVAPVCTEPAPTFTPSLCYWNTKRTDDSRCPACPRVSCLADCECSFVVDSVHGTIQVLSAIRRAARCGQHAARARAPPLRASSCVRCGPVPARARPFSPAAFRASACAARWRARTRATTSWCSDWQACQT